MIHSDQLSAKIKFSNQLWQKGLNAMNHIYFTTDFAGSKKGEHLGAEERDAI